MKNFNSSKVLIIEDDIEINKLLSLILNENEIETVSAFSGTEGLLQIQAQNFHLILLDLMLPGMDGETFIVELRKISKIPVVVISSKSGIDDKVNLLKLGADDYITKPFNKEEVVARVEVQLRRLSSIVVSKNYTIWRELVLDKEKMLVTLSGINLNLTNAEYDILCLLIENPERVFSKRAIYEKIWHGAYLGDDNTISVHMSNIRKKFAEISSDEYIKTIWGIGFMLV